MKRKFLLIGLVLLVASLIIGCPTSVVEAAVVEEPVIEEAVVEAAVVEEPVVEKPVVEEPPIPAYFTTHTDEAKLFSISYPADWELPLNPGWFHRKAWKAVTDVVDAVLDVVTDVVDVFFEVLDVVADVVEVVVDVVDVVVDSAIDLFDTWVDAVSTIAGDVWEEVTGWFDTGVEEVVEEPVVEQPVVEEPVVEQPVVEQPPIPAHFTTYTDEANLFSISYPADWELALWAIEDVEQFAKELIESIESGLPLERASAIFIAGLPTEIGFSPSVNIVVESLPGVGWTLDEVVETSFQTVKDLLGGYREFSRVKTTIGGRGAVIVDWAATLPGVGKSRFLTMTALVGETVWTVTCTPELGKFDQSEDDFYAIVRSLRILK